MTPTLLILAAGMGSRYGGLKQLDRFGPEQLTIMDYSIRDAIKVGFKKVVFVIRKDFESQFRTQISNHYQDAIEIALVFQTTKIDGLEIERSKPWGTGHAILTAAGAISDPFTVINADDFYGKKAFEKAAVFLRTQVSSETYGMVAYVLSNTLSPNGTVSRGICTLDERNYLIGVEEHTKIGENNGGVMGINSNNQLVNLNPKSLVSMNLWMFHQSIFTDLKEAFQSFLSKNAEVPGSEFYIPSFIDDQLKATKLKVIVEKTTDKWYGVTYQEDRNRVNVALSDLYGD